MADDIKRLLWDSIQQQSPELFKLACDIFDRPENGYQEFFASGLLSDYLERSGFSVERGACGLATAFRAEWENGSGGPVIGFLGEYDALNELGHGCGHHLQTPACIGAAMALRKHLDDVPYKLVVYGTPAEETTGGKIDMIEAGCFRELDVAFSYHSGRATGVSGGSKALQSATVTFLGIPSHASSSPHLGRSALDAMVLSFHGVECMREHLMDGSRVHYTVREGTGPSNIVHERAVAAYTLRAPDRPYLEDMTRRFKKIIEGAAMMTETRYEISLTAPFYNLISIPALNQAALANEEFYRLPRIERTQASNGGSTDFGNVSWVVPSVMVYTYYCDAPGHSKEWVAAGKSEAARESMISGAAVMAATAYDVITRPDLWALVKEQFRQKTSGPGMSSFA